MQDNQNTGHEAESPRTLTLELCFSLFILLVVLSGFLSALTYDMVSARTPLVIMAPLLILTILEVRRSWKAAAAANVNVTAHLSEVFGLKNPEFNQRAGFFLWMVVLLLLIFVAGHYAGIAAFIFMMLHMVADEKPGLSVAIACSTSLLLYLLFELVFSMELYRGLIYRIWAGYSVF